jgi:hypothetical protein
MRQFKKGDIAVNPKHDDKAAAIHPLLHLDKEHAAIITHKPPIGVKGIKIEPTDVYGLEFDSRQSYATDEIVKNTSGKKIGGIKSSFLPKLNNLAKNLGTDDFKYDTGD